MTLYKNKYIHGFLTAAVCAGLTFLVVAQTRVDLHPFSVRFTPPEFAYGYSSSLTGVCSSLEGYWKLDETSGTSAADSSENSHTGTLQNTDDTNWSTSTSTALGFANTRSLSLNGSTQYVSVAASSALQITGDVTVSLWINYDTLSSAASGNVLLSHGIAGEDASDNLMYQVSVKDDKTLRMQWENGAGTDITEESSTTATLTASSWHHIAFTRSSADKEVKFYASGVLLGTAQSFSLDPSGGGSGSLFIGRSADGTNYFDGKLDDIRIYTSVLTGSQILALAGGSDAYAGCTCGNGTIESPETCDNGGSNSDTTADACRSSCRVASCGDGAIDSSEECDDGASNSDSTADACRTDCVSAVCGDGVVDTDETCDDGNNVNSDSCTNSCTESSCGDEVIQDGEECDDGSANSDTISNACRDSCLLPSCGDSVVDLGETCDAGEATSTCDTDCTAPSCGDGLVNTASGEECDSGDDNSDSEVDGCRTTCLSASCGDGIVDTGEDCDDGNSVDTDTCTSSCKNPSCGDGYIQESNNETCEPPNTGTCASNCIGLTGGGGSSNSRSRSRSTTGISKKNTLDLVEVEEERDPPPEGCGNRLYEPEKGEECDEGIRNGQGSCSYECKQLYCGDGVVSSSTLEECEPVPVSIQDGIPYFEEPTCGVDACTVPDIDASSGRVTGGCKRIFLPACSEEEEPELRPAASEEAICGNDEVESGEDCDDGNEEDNDGCSSTCLEEICGDGIVQEGEACDNGKVCSNDGENSCSSDLECAVSDECIENDDGILTCGGMADGDECESTFDCSYFGKCEYNSKKDDSCTVECTIALACGDGKKDEGEECDDGNTKNNDGCSKACSLEEGIEQRCGDSIVTENEECDDGNTVGGDGCSAFCIEEQFCGDGKTSSSEECDDGNSDDGDGCSVLCTIEEESTESPITVTEPEEAIEEPLQELALENRVLQSLCGNRVVEEGEQCDDGANNSNTTPNSCRTNCTLPVCGDGIMDLSEQCDEGTSNTDVLPDHCRRDCSLPTCGDKVIDSNEQCDGGILCTQECTLPQSQCGNGYVEAGEQCDDGNIFSGDGCGPTCINEPKILGLAECGNGIRERGEACDDGNLQGGDGCSPICGREMPKSVSITQQPQTQVAGQTAVIETPPQVPVATPAQAAPERIVFNQPVQTSVPWQPAQQRQPTPLPPQQIQQQVSAQQWQYLQPIQQIPPQYMGVQYASVIPISASHTPIGDTGPGALFIVIAGAAGGFGMTKRRRKS
jgi:cysteine-rich repeat protein